MILDASIDGLPCFPFQTGGQIIALSVIFSWLVGCVKPLKFKGFETWQAQSENLFSIIECFLLAI
jgi:hypothetical protein